MVVSRAFHMVKFSWASTLKLGSNPVGVPCSEKTVSTLASQ